MKKLFLALAATLMVMGVHAQEGKKAVRQASRSLGTFNLDQTNNKAELREAVELIEVGLEDPEMAKDPGSYLTKGEIYNEVANQWTVAMQLGQDTTGLPKVESPAIKAAEAYMKALELAEKRYERKDAAEGMLMTQGHLLNAGVAAFQNEQDFDLAYRNFQLVIDLHKQLKAENEDSRLDEEADYQQQLYLTGLAALNSERVDKAEEYFKELYKADYQEAAIYESLYTITAQDTTKMDEAYAYLEEGRQKFPDQVSLLFAEINHFLKLGKLDQLIDKLKDAIEAEPNNVSLYSTLGSVYDNLYQKEVQAGNDEKAQEYFDMALDYYQQAAEIDPKYVDAIYSIGALYYNKAAAMTQDLNKLADDYSKEGLKKYDALKKDVFAQFDKALPYFQKAESIDPNDMNTLIALKEIYARKDDLEKSKVFKERFDKVQAGEKLQDSYFDKQ